MEDEEYAGMQEAWEEYKDMTRMEVENHIRVLKNEMEKVSSAASLIQKKVSVDPKGFL